MKIKSINIRNHKILGNLNLDFTNKNGEIYDTVIFMGENGVGKSTLLNFISTIFQAKNVNKNNVNSTCSFIISLEFTADEINKINDDFRLNNYSGGVKLTKNRYMTITYDPISESNSAANYKIENILQNYSAAVLFTLNRLFPTIFSPAQTNLKCRDIVSTTTKNIDEKLNNSIVASEQLAQEIKQMFIDIEASDSSDLANWVNKNSGQVPPDEVKQVRMKRFNNAFYTIFSDKLKFDRVENIANKKQVYFNSCGQDVIIDNISSGQKQIVYRGAFFLKDKGTINGSIALIDEPEISMHPKWQMEILNYYKSLFTNEKGKQTSQLFISSHSEYILKSKTENDLVLIFNKNSDNKITIKAYEKENILPFSNFAENKYYAFDMPTLEFFNELYAYIEWRQKDKIDVFIRQNSSNIDKKYSKYTQFRNWRKDNGKTISITLLTHFRHEIHHPENTLNIKLYNCDEDLREPIEFMLYLIRTFSI